MGVPAFWNEHLNPYNALLYRAMQRTGTIVHDLSARRLAGRRYDIMHLHWPEYLFSAPTLLRAVIHAVTFVVVMSWMRVRSTPIVWTVHNLSAHEPTHPRLERYMWRWLVRRVDAYIALSRTGASAALERFPDLEPVPGFVIPHGHYRDAYPNTIDRDDARAALGLGRHEAVLLFFGTIRPYKNVGALIEAFRGTTFAHWRLVIAGGVPDDDLRDELMAAAAADPRIRLTLEFVADEEIQHYMHAADLVVLPYREVLNSGSVLLALSFGVPVLVPSVGAMVDLQQDAGPEWVRTFNGELTPETLDHAVDWAIAQERCDAPAIVEHSWDDIAEQTLASYDEVLRLPRAVSTRRRAQSPTLKPWG